MTSGLRGLAHKTWHMASTGSVVLVACMVLFLLPSAWAGGKKKAAPQVDISRLVWPPPPDQPRIRYLGQYFGELDLIGKKQVKGGVLERIAGVNITPEERPRLAQPYGVAVDSRGQVYVPDMEQGLVFVFDLENKKLQFRGDKAPANLLIPVGVVVDEQDRLFVSDSKAHQITCFGPAGDLESVFGADQLKRPAAMAVDGPLRRLYVVDVGGKRIAVFDLDTLKFLRYFAEIKDKNADRTGALTSPNGIAIDPDGLLYITDAIGARVLVYDTDGNFVRTWGKRGDGPAMFGRPRGIAIDVDGHVYVADALLNRVQVFSPEGKPLMDFSGRGFGPGQFMLMAGLATDSRNRIVAVDQVPPRIQLFRYTTDAEAAAVKEGRKLPETGSGEGVGGKTPAPGKAPSEVQPPANPAASSGPTVEELQKELAELKAKLAAQQQQQKPDTGKGGTQPADKPVENTPSSPH